MPSTIQLDGIPDGILLSNEQGDILEVNTSMCELFGYTVDQLKGQPLEVLLPDNVRARHHEYTEMVFGDMRRREMAHRTQVYGRHASGFNIEIGIHLAPCLVDGAKAVWCVVRDMRSYNEALSHRQAATRHAESVTGFLRLLNHDVRTSVHGCVMALDTVRHDLHTPTTIADTVHWKLPPSWTLLEDAINKMSTMLTDMVDLRNLQDGNLSCPNAHFTIETVVEQVLQPYSLRRTTKNQQLLIATQADMPAMFGSMEAFVKGVAPLISNASKYSARGTQILLAFHLENDPQASEQTSRSTTASTSSPLHSSTRSESDPSSPCWPRERSGSALDVSGLNPAIALSRLRPSPTLRGESMIPPSFLRCSVYDHGSGILPSLISKMAAGSFQLDTSSTRHTEAGIGFGLSIAKLVAEQIGGQLSVQSKPTCVALPSTSSQHSRAPSGEDRDVNGVENSHYPPFVCVSCQPDCSSSTICQSCEEEFARGATTCFALSMPVVVVVTGAGKAENDDSEPALDDLQQRALVSAPTFQSRVVLQILSAKAETIRQRAALKILLVEDSLINIKVLSACLRKRGFTNLTVAHNGQEACDSVGQRLLSPAAATERASSAFEHAFPFSVVFMDCEMPVMDGFVCSTKLKAIPHCCPIFALTANVTNEVRQQCAAAGMDLFFSKPLQANDLIFALALLDPFNHYLMQHSPHALSPGQLLL